MKLIKIYGLDTEHYIINSNQIVQIVKPVHSKNDITQIHLSNGKVIETETLPKDLEDILNKL